MTCPLRAGYPVDVLGSVRQRALALVQQSPDGLTAKAVATALGVPHDQAANRLARLYWAGTLDRYREPDCGPGGTYTYTPRRHAEA